MKIDIYKIIVIALLLAIVLIQLTLNDSGRYELNSTDGYVFDTKTAKLYSLKAGVIDFLDEANKKQKAYQKRIDSIN